VITEILKALDYSDSIVISPDFDGLLSAAIINKYKRISISGIYTTNRLFMLNNSDPKDSIWIDHDIRQNDIVSIGCHAVYPNIKVNQLSFNPHRAYNQHPDNCFKGMNSKSRDKFPFSTSVLLAHAYKWFPDDPMSIMLLGHADSGHKVYNQYKNNVEAWASDFTDRNVELIMDTSPEPIYDALKKSGYKKGSFQKSNVNVSNETNYINNIRLMADFINNYIPMPKIDDIVSTTKFTSKEHKYSGNIDSESLRIVDESLSYAVIFNKHISYTHGSI
jgi:hypothetical protein